MPILDRNRDASNGDDKRPPDDEDSIPPETRLRRATRALRAWHRIASKIAAIRDQQAVEGRRTDGPRASRMRYLDAEVHFQDERHRRAEDLAYRAIRRLLPDRPGAGAAPRRLVKFEGRLYAPWVGIAGRHEPGGPGPMRPGPPKALDLSSWSFAEISEAEGPVLVMRPLDRGEEEGGENAGGEGAGTVAESHVIPEIERAFARVAKINARIGRLGENYSRFAGIEGEENDLSSRYGEAYEALKRAVTEAIDTEETAFNHWFQPAEAPFQVRSGGRTFALMPIDAYPHDRLKFIDAVRLVVVGGGGAL